MLTNLREKAGAEASPRGKEAKAETEKASKVEEKAKAGEKGVKAKAVGNDRNEAPPLLAKRTSHPAGPTSQENARRALLATTGILLSAFTGRRANAPKMVAHSFTVTNLLTKLLALHHLQPTLRLKVNQG